MVSVYVCSFLDWNIRRVVIFSLVRKDLFWGSFIERGFKRMVYLFLKIFIEDVRYFLFLRICF